jgi:hypothetical protein
LGIEKVTRLIEDDAARAAVRVPSHATLFLPHLIHSVGKTKGEAVEKGFGIESVGEGDRRDNDLTHRIFIQQA